MAPNAVTQRFRRLARQAGLPPIRLHDLRHGAATLALDAGIDIKVGSDQLGHSTTTLTRDTYQSVVKRLHHEAATASPKESRTGGDVPLERPGRGIAAAAWVPKDCSR
ncbi:tyrosine-type recombinase/integrase [Micromonospora chersina]|uniref:tyrosine-type recombinase/integrase n=1 Tax=Micromonospora chersina TaxID=47854 RepID=UPI003714D92A